MFILYEHVRYIDFKGLITLIDLIDFVQCDVEYLDETTHQKIFY